MTVTHRGVTGEDDWFFQNIRRYGIKAYVDHTLSMEIGHVAETYLTFGA